ncbi:TIR domain-containing adapter molecule 2 isoform X2 [Dasypus novemcinctus]|uniref:TIR domain-containing adapter molecule 2 isoform X2 n=1 Tax=Dasypus novemcinctus TaxID=9361 RepID=UPI0039C914F3
MGGCFLPWRVQGTKWEVRASRRVGAGVSHRRGGGGCSPQPDTQVCTAKARWTSFPRRASKSGRTRGITKKREVPESPHFLRCPVPHRHFLSSAILTQLLPSAVSGPAESARRLGPACRLAATRAEAASPEPRALPAARGEAPGEPRPPGAQRRRLAVGGDSSLLDFRAPARRARPGTGACGRWDGIGELARRDSPASRRLGEATHPQGLLSGRRKASGLAARLRLPE